MSITTVRTIAQLRQIVGAWRRDGLTIGLVPTMGALHDGHLSLVKTALGACDRVIVTLFVNPTQFGEGEDFSAYPRDEDRDRGLLDGEGAHVLFAPSVKDMYPAGFHATEGQVKTEVRVSGLDKILEGRHRPGHFTGVATVVTKLLGLADADKAFFGEKDYQQLLVIKTLARDLCINTAIHGVPTMREDDGLAMSSRNVYLTPYERKTAPLLNAVLHQVAEGFRRGEPGRQLCQNAQTILRDAGFELVDYVAIVDASTLERLEIFDASRPVRILAAATLGRARLIDNIALDPDMAHG